MDRTRKFQGVYKEGHVDSSTQRDLVRLSSIEQGLEDSYSDEECGTSGYTGYVKTIKSDKRQGTQPWEPRKSSRKNQEGVRRFRWRFNNRNG